MVSRSASSTAPYPGTSTRVSTPWARSAAGSATVTSPKPPLLTHGGISGETNSTRSTRDRGAGRVATSADTVVVLPEHVGRDEGHAGVGDIEALAVGFGIDAHRH